jgi:hypothetical protein
MKSESLDPESTSIKITVRSERERKGSVKLVHELPGVDAICMLSRGIP